MDYNRKRASAQYSRLIDERLTAEYYHRCKVFAWEERVQNLELKLSSTVDAEAQASERNNELAVRLASENTIRLRVPDARACDVAAMNSVGAGIDGVLVWMDEIIGLWAYCKETLLH